MMATLRFGSASGLLLAYDFLYRISFPKGKNAETPPKTLSATRRGLFRI